MKWQTLIIAYACQITNPEVITLDEVLTSIEEQKLSVKESKVNDNNIFGMKLNGVKPSSYELDGKMFQVYIYDSAEEREKDLEDFRNKTAAMNIVSYNTYEVKNVLIFYVQELDLSMEVEFDDEIREAVSELDIK